MHIADSVRGLGPTSDSYVATAPSLSLISASRQDSHDLLAMFIPIALKRGTGNAIARKTLC